MSHCKKYLPVLLLLILTAILTSLCSASELLSYVQKPDPVYNWKKIDEAKTMSGKRVVLSMTSQVWQNITWNHRIEVYIPEKNDYPDIATLIITGGNGGGLYSDFCQFLSSISKSTVAVLYNIPNQPLFDGRSEDSLIAYTFMKTLETGDHTWPLLLPMTKSAVRAMDALQAYTKSSGRTEIKRFVVGGASKRGWTTWLTGAVDTTRVKGIIPMVYDNLDLNTQMKLQIEAYGVYSQEINDYTDNNLQAKLSSSAGSDLARIVDPYTYIKQITMPKLIINGANDPYWNICSMNVYWPKLRGAKAVVYVPNAGHDLGLKKYEIQNALNVVGPITAFVKSVADKTTLPKMKWKYVIRDHTLQLNINTSAKNTRARMWVAKSTSRDFRPSKWEPVDMDISKSGFSKTVALPKDGYQTVYGEVMFPGEPGYSLNTQVCCTDSSKKVGY